MSICLSRIIFTFIIKAQITIFEFEILWHNDFDRLVALTPDKPGLVLRFSFRQFNTKLLCTLILFIIKCVSFLLLKVFVYVVMTEFVV